MSKPWLSVITAVKDDPSGLAHTLESLRSQDLSGVEIVIIDSSLDRDAARVLASDVADVYWEEPAGIYAAMNSGLSRAAGTFVYFLNAGDVLHAPDVLSRVRPHLDSTCVWAFGPVELVASGGARIVTPSWNFKKEKARLFARGYFPQHQGVFVRKTTLMHLGGFSTRYRIASDYNSFLELSLIADPVHLDFVIADFLEGGTSTVEWQASFREFHRARRSIFNPQGLSSIREHLDTANHFARVWAYREVLLPLRRLARR